MDPITLDNSFLTLRGPGLIEIDLNLGRAGITDLGVTDGAYTVNGRPMGKPSYAITLPGSSLRLRLHLAPEPFNTGTWHLSLDSGGLRLALELDDATVQRMLAELKA